MTEITHEALEALLTRYEELVGRHYRGTLELRGQAEKYEADLHLAADVRQALRTGQLVPAQPSGDVVEAVGMALCENALGGKACPCKESGVFKCHDAHPGHQATAAITAYEAVSGVAKMRDALDSIRRETVGVVPEILNLQMCIHVAHEVASEALGEKP